MHHCVTKFMSQRHTISAGHSFSAIVNAAFARDSDDAHGILCFCIDVAEHFIIKDIKD